MPSPSGAQENIGRISPCFECTILSLPPQGNLIDGKGKILGMDMAVKHEGFLWWPVV